MAVEEASLKVKDVAQKKSRIQVSNTKKPLFFYVNLAKKYMQQYDEVELSALGMAITTVVTVAEILKNNDLAIEKKIVTSSVTMKDEAKGRTVQKAKIEITMEKSEKFNKLINSNNKKSTAAASTAAATATTATATTATATTATTATAAAAEDDENKNKEQKKSSDV